MTQSAASIARSSRSYYLFFVCYLAALGAFPSFVNDLYLPTLPQMSAEFHCSRSVTQLGLSFVMIGLGLGELFWGPLSDKTGRKPVLVMSLIVFILASGISVFSPSIGFFIGCRLLQGLGASGAVMLAKTIPADKFSGRELAKIMSVIGAINGIAPVSGPLVGGFMAHAIGWRGIFVVLTLIGATMLALAAKYRETLPPDKRNKAPLLRIMREFVPLVKDKHFMTHTMLKSAALGVLFCYISAGPFILQEHYGFSAMTFGLIFGLNAMGVVGGAIVSVKFRTMKKAAVTGASLAAAFAIAEGIAISLIDSVWVFESLVIPMLFFLGIVFAAANTLAMSEGRGKAGAASAILGLGGYIFGFIVSPLVGLGNILTSTSIGMIACALICVWFALLSWRLPADKIQP
ncbi:MAG: multidrug effflux MFS transporter [Desulfovibrio sp.]|nr:multidrug effflux MFS transporter [Desulfovibrio sp.]